MRPVDAERILAEHGPWKFSTGSAVLSHGCLRVLAVRDRLRAIGARICDELDILDDRPWWIEGLDEMYLPEMQEVLDHLDDGEEAEAA